MPLKVEKIGIWAVGIDPLGGNGRLSILSY
jgi:hypothetical protein